jgi:hypothetical protein
MGGGNEQRGVFINGKPNEGVRDTLSQRIGRFMARAVSTSPACDSWKVRGGAPPLRASVCIEWPCIVRSGGIADE